ncbi:MAG: hypothetical protein K6L75_06080 [Cellvibrionaceae bacterium]
MITAELSSTPSTAMTHIPPSQHSAVNDFFTSDSPTNNHPYQSPSPALKSGVTVMNFSEDSFNNSQNSRLILNSLLSFASNSDDQRWATFITTDPSEYLRLHQLKLNSKKFRIVYLKNKSDLLWVTWDALAAGNSHTVIIQGCLDKDTMNGNAQENLNKAANLGNTAGIFLNSLPTSIPMTG